MGKNRSEIIYGIHTVRHALEQMPENILELLVQKDKKSSRDFENLLDLAKNAGVSIQQVTRDYLDKNTNSALHQGVAVKRKTDKNEHQVDLDTILERRALIEGQIKAGTNQVIRLMRDIPVPVIAAVNGAAAGAGFSLALASDFVVAAQSAKFHLSFAKIGAVLDAGSSSFLTHKIGAARTTSYGIGSKSQVCRCLAGPIHYLLETQASGSGAAVWPTPAAISAQTPLETTTREQFRQEFRALDHHRAPARRALQPVPGRREQGPAGSDGLLRLPGRRAPGRDRRGAHPRQHDHRAHLRRPPVPDLRPGQFRYRGTPRGYRRAHHGQAGRGIDAPAAFGPHLLVPDAAADRRVDFLHAPDAGRRRQGDGFRQIEGASADRTVGQGDLWRRRGHRRSQAGT